MPLPQGAELFLNRELEASNAMSGHAYLAAVLKGAPGKQKLIVASPKRCGHTNRICTDCWDEWADYRILWERTAAGRKMHAELVKRGLMQEGRET